MRSANFDHLRAISEQLFRLGFLAERFFAEDPNTSLIKSRQFAESLLKEAAARTGTYQPELRETFSDLLARLSAERVIPREVGNVFHAIRKQGNAAVHQGSGSHGEALSCLKFTRSLGVWFHQTFARDSGFKPGPFVPPPDPQGESRELAQQLEALRQRVREAEAQAAAANVSAEEQARARAAAEEMAQREREDREVWELLAREQEAAQARLGEELARLQAAAKAEPQQATVSLIQAGRDAATKLELDEADTRLLIDVQLSEMGWEADSQELRYAKGARPEQGRNRAIAEWPTESGPVDYALFIGLTCVGVVEAKKQSVDVPAILEQAKRYARTIKLAPENLGPGAPWQHGLNQPFRVPFIFATNGRPYVRQWIAKSGIWHWEARREINHPVALPEWFSPDDLKAKLEQDTSAAHLGLGDEAFGYGSLYPYQEEAIRAIERAVEAGQRDVLISMATGTGKTRTCIALMYRLLKHKRFRRILFLVDRTALGDQTTDALETTELEGFYKFSQIYKVAGLDQRLPEPEDQVQIATVQAMVARILTEPDPTRRLTPGTYDCIIVDEAHRGYTLDAELRESDIGFRNVDGYQSAYRQVLDYFDAVKIGLTATPALHTREIFGHPVYRYGYRQAVVEGYLMDHLPPKRITTALAEAGIHFEGGEEVEIVDPRTGQIDLFELPDDVNLDYDLAAFNKRVYSENFNRVVCQAIAAEIPPDRPGKTLIFAARDSHADDVVRLLTQALEEEYGPIPAGMVQKITGSVPDNKDLILKFRNDPYPQYVVTVDLLTTGIDIPSISSLVFMRRVSSRILYDQMIGRATRLCPAIGKEHFRIFDAVDLYANLQEMSDMRPVVVRPDINLAQLVTDLEQAGTDEDRNWVGDQIVVRMRNLAKRMDDAQREEFSRHARQSPEEALAALQSRSGSEKLEWFRQHPRAIEILDRRPVMKARPGDGVAISNHQDELLHIREIFGESTTPEDYIEGFERFVRENMNAVPALVAATQRPRELTRTELSELASLLDERHYSEGMLRAAYGRARNADIAAHIIGFVRQAALGDPLVPYKTRVENAILKVEKSHPWTPNQKSWLRRIGRALQDKPVADASLLQQGAFAQVGGFAVIARDFDNRLEPLLQEINEAIWASPAA